MARDENLSGERGDSSVDLHPFARGFARTERKIHIGFAVALACVAAIGVVAHLSVASFRDDTRWVVHSHQVLTQIEVLESDIADAQNRLRGFAMTGDSQQLSTYGTLTDRIASATTMLRELVADNAEQRQRVSRESQIIEGYLGFSRGVIEARSQHGFDAARALLLSNEGGQLREQSAGLLNEMRAAEYRLLATRRERARRSAALTDSVIVGGSALAFLTAAFAAIAIRRDLLGRRRAENEVRRLNRDLQLRAEQVESANQELEAFSYSVSHDLRAPLRHIEGYVDLLQQELGASASPDTGRFLSTIARSTQRMNTLIDELLAFSRMGRRALQNELVDLPALIADVRRDLEMSVRGRNIVWQIEPLPRVRGDRAMIRQALANLLGNAVKYTRPRNPAIIQVAAAGLENDREIIAVRDNGVGFDMKYAGKLFGVFQRLHQEKDFEGTGIGLANVQRIVVRHGGRVWADAKPNEGAVFYFTLEKAG